MEAVHRAVLLEESVDFLRVRPGALYIDATVGQAGHALEIVRRGGRVLGIEANPETRRWLNQNIKAENLVIAAGNFVDLKKIAQTAGFAKVQGIIFDLGLSTFELENSGRGFSYLKNEPLDMRFDPQVQALSAAGVLESLSQEELYEIFTKFGEITNAGRLSRALVRQRKLGKIVSTFDLVSLVETALLPREGKSPGLRFSSLSKVFQALRIFVNQELAVLRLGLPQALELLAPGGRLVTLSFHSLEDRVVKNQFRVWQAARRARVLTSRPLRAPRTEILKNRASQSVRLRALERI